MRTIIYKIIETPDEKFCLFGTARGIESKLLYVGEEDRCRKILKDIEHGHRTEAGCKIILEKEIEVIEASDIH